MANDLKEQLEEKHEIL